MNNGVNYVANRGWAKAKVRSKARDKIVLVVGLVWLVMTDTCTISVRIVAPD